MKISIITVCYNSAETIEDTIRSVIGQTHDDLEYIIIDGGSTDGTLQIIDKYKEKITKIISEKDQGIYDAMNKGLNLVTGEIVGIINSDDFYCDNMVLSKINKMFLQKIDACYGDLVYVHSQDITKVVRYWKAGEYSEKKIYRGWIMPHPVFFVKKEVYNKQGVFNLNFKIAADYELMLRFLFQGLKIKYISESLVCMREGGYSAKNFKQRLKGWREIKQSWKINNKKIPLLLISRRIFSKVSQYFI